MRFIALVLVHEIFSYLLTWTKKKQNLCKVKHSSIVRV